MEGLIGNAGEGALRMPSQHDVAGNEKRFLLTGFLVGRARGVIIRTLHKIDTRPRGHFRSDERAFGIEVNADTHLRIGFTVYRQGKAAGKNRKSKKERAFSL